VFPELVARGDPQLIAHGRRLREDHGWIDEDRRMLAPQIEAIAGAKQAAGAAGRVAG
jgi:hypothetical protein